MAIIILTLAIIGIAALARYGTDSRNLVDSRPDSFPALPDHTDAWIPAHTR